MGHVILDMLVLSADDAARLIAECYQLAASDKIRPTEIDAMSPGRGLTTGAILGPRRGPQPGAADCKRFELRCLRRRFVPYRDICRADGQ